MSRTRKDLTGRRFTRLTVIEISSKRTGAGKALWRCKCDCGNETLTQSQELLGEHAKSCGCLSSERTSERNRTHGLSKKVPEYGTWTRLRGRCLNPNSPDYPDYGARGITVCAEWNSFERFYTDMGSRPSPSHSIDRINNDGPYAPWNCRWATPRQQRQNNRNSRFLTFADKTLTLSEWSREIGVPRATLVSRIERGFAPADVLETGKSRGWHRKRKAVLSEA